jgi:hypothetical protein
MLFRVRHLAFTAALALAGLALTASPAWAQRQPVFRQAPGRMGTGVIYSLNPYAVNPYQYIPGTTTTYQQYAYNQALLARAYTSFPPWYYGYNPYPSVVNIGPSFPTIRPTYTPYYGSVYNPYGAYGLTASAYNPYLIGGYGYGLGGINPYFGY